MTTEIPEGHSLVSDTEIPDNLPITAGVKDVLAQYESGNVQHVVSGLATSLLISVMALETEIEKLKKRLDE